MENIDIDINIDKDNSKNIDIDIDIDMVILENIDIDIDIDKDILENIDIVIDIDKGVIKIPIKQWCKMGAKSDHFCPFSAYLGVFSPVLLMEYRIFISIVDISANFKNIGIDIDIDKEILENIDIDKISNRLEFGISNRATLSIFSKFADISTIDINIRYSIHKTGGKTPK